MEGRKMARIYKPVGPSSNKATAPVEEIKKPSGQSQKKQEKTGGQ